MEILPLLIFLFIGWTIFKNVSAAGKGIEKAAKGLEDVTKRDASWQENMSAIQARLKEHAERDEFEISPELKEDWSFDKKRTNKTPTQRGRETLQKRLERHHNTAPKPKSFKKGAAQKYKPRDSGRGKDFGLNSRHEPQKDQNRHRRDDWGARGGGEIISTKSLLVLLALGFIVLYVLSKVSPSGLGF